jgi:hypothetical protein
MAPTNDWHSFIAAESHMSPDAARQLREIGFIVMPGPAIKGGCEQLSDAYDYAVATADPADVHIGRTTSSTRIDDFVNRGSESDGIYIYQPLLAACCQIIGAPFKLSGMRARTLNPGAPAEGLHVDVKHRANGWPLVGCIFMVDAFDAENGATRFVPGSHLQSREPGEVMNNSTRRPRQGGPRVWSSRINHHLQRVGMALAMVQTGRAGHGVRYKLILSHEKLKHRRPTIPGACVRRLCSVSVIWRSMF